MSAVMTIAWRDFKSIFYSPRAATAFLVFLFLLGIFFNNYIAMFLQYLAQAPQGLESGPTIDQLIRAVFHNIHFILILVIPAVTMALFSEEKRSQVFKLLQKAPVSSTQIVMGKFFSALFVMSLILAATIVYPGYIAAYGNPDWGFILTSYLGVFLLICAQLSFGIWVSSMTNNQFISCLFTILGLFALMILNWLAEDISGNSIVESSLKYIAFSDHLDSFLKGMITVSDISYFLCFTSFFLFLSVLVVDSLRWR